MVVQRDAAGLAAFSICEALLITLVEKGVLSIDDVQAALEDAAAAHQSREAADVEMPFHRMAVQMVERMMMQMNAADPDGRHE